MLKARVIPCLLLRGRGLYKTRRFENPKYVGDPVNAVRIFNEKEVDELILLDILATPENREPNYELIADICSECFMPLSYGGAVTSIDRIRKLHRIGVEKVSLNSVTITNANMVRESCDTFGSSSIIGSIDVKRNLWGKYETWINCGKTNTKKDPIEHAELLAKLGVGEILVNSIDRDGMMGGYDTTLLRRITEAVDTPVIACGGAGTLDHIVAAVHEGGVSAVAAGSMFVFHGKHRAVLLNYPRPEELEAL